MFTIKPTNIRNFTIQGFTSFDRHINRFTV
jgi:hypothetical protein